MLHPLPKKIYILGILDRILQHLFSECLKKGPEQLHQIKSLLNLEVMTPFQFEKRQSPFVLDNTVFFSLN